MANPIDISPIRNPLGWLLNQKPGRLLLGSWLIGLAIIAWSWIVGAGWFWADIRFQFEDGKFSQPRTLGLGYIQQLNYGPWHFLPFLCPAVFFLAGLTAQAIHRSIPKDWSDQCSLLRLAREPIFRILGWVSLLGFPFLNIWVEVREQPKVSTGWVQAKSIEKNKTQNIPFKEIASSNPFLVEELPIGEKPGEIHPIKGMQIDNIRPEDFKVAPDILFWSFVYVAKAWEGLWESLVCYLGILVICAEYRLFFPSKRAASKKTASEVIEQTSLAYADQAMLPDTAQQEDDYYGIGWLRRPSKYILMIGVLVNIFFILRFAANFHKGSFGFWDQCIEIATLIIIPDTAIALIAVMAIARFLLASEVSHDDKKKFATESLTKWFRVWCLTSAFFLYLMMLYFVPPINDLVRWILGKMTASKLS